MMNKERTKLKDKQTEAALELLPPVLRAAALRAIDAYGLDLSEITDLRIRRDGASYIGADSRSFKIDACVSAREFDDFIFKLCGGSLYACADAIREGYINAGGIRCGVCGRAVVRGGVISEVAEISAVCIRIPRDIGGVSERIYSLMESCSFGGGILIYSQPGIGKTTLLRDLIRRLSAEHKQLAVIDCRGELAPACSGGSADLLSLYPKAEGIRSAVRAMSPQLIICDELFGADDAEAAAYAYACGVPIIATVHGGSLYELYARSEISRLLSLGVFKYTVGISRQSGNRSYDFNISKTQQNPTEASL